LFDMVFVLVVVLTLVQGPTLPWVARLLGLSADLTATDLDVDSSPLGVLDADVIHVRVGPSSRLHGVEVFELRLPARANVTLVVRDGEAFVPEPTTMLRRGDDLIVVATSSVRAAAEDRLAAVSRTGKLAGWLPAG
jgi:cell volume regulation protein A